MTKANQMVSMDFELRTALREAAKLRGISISDLAEQGVRLVLAMPAPMPVDPEAQELKAIERVILGIMTKWSPFGWYGIDLITKTHGASKAVTEKALLALERAGKVFCWGRGLGVESPELVRPHESRWGTRDPIDITRKVADRLMKQTDLEAGLETIRTLRKMLTGVSQEIAQACENLIMTTPSGGWLRINPWDRFVGNRTESDEFQFKMDEQSRIYDSPEGVAARAASAKAHIDAIDAHRKGEIAHDAEQKRLDLEYRLAAAAAKDDSEN